MSFEEKAGVSDSDEEEKKAFTLRHCHMDGYVHLASSWFQFNVSGFLPAMTVPTLILVPEHDVEMGYPKELFEKEIAAMPPGMGRLLEFPGYGHMMVGEPGGAKKTFDAVDAFISEKTA